MLHLLYILAFTVIAVLAIANLIRSLIQVSTDANRRYGANRTTPQPQKQGHPELMDNDGQPINEPLLVMRSVNVDEARQQLDALYNSSPGGNRPEANEEN
ncbi:DUF2973 domain-containing protein [Spirulina sp. CS-785/01]|uniref:DUF2973 domain-containing protein n=1 Tax=Spirulina sp. CS-785/01 TaxID=3021716 RepID=UPI00232F621C|nr:DUF2973 domain-containing protein [Spirulina sp. CS-785/01]MDB9311611.1 DUF2973 domain-containing protein [Spirulina sp. CS-785/01]